MEYLNARSDVYNFFTVSVFIYTTPDITYITDEIVGNVTAASNITADTDIDVAAASNITANTVDVAAASNITADTRCCCSL